MYPGFNFHSLLVVTVLWPLPIALTLLFLGKYFGHKVDYGQTDETAENAPHGKFADRKSTCYR